MLQVVLWLTQCHRMKKTSFQHSVPTVLQIWYTRVLQCQISSIQISSQEISIITIVGSLCFTIGYRALSVLFLFNVVVLKMLSWWGLLTDFDGSWKQLVPLIISNKQCSVDSVPDISPVWSRTPPLRVDLPLNKGGLFGGSGPKSSKFSPAAL